MYGMLVFSLEAGATLYRKHRSCFFAAHTTVSRPALTEQSPPPPSSPNLSAPKGEEYAAAAAATTATAAATTTTSWRRQQMSSSSSLDRQTRRKREREAEREREREHLSEYLSSALLAFSWRFFEKHPPPHKRTHNGNISRGCQKEEEGEGGVRREGRGVLQGARPRVHRLRVCVCVFRVGFQTADTDHFPPQGEKEDFFFLLHFPISQAGC